MPRCLKINRLNEKCSKSLKPKNKKDIKLLIKNKQPQIESIR